MTDVLPNGDDFNPADATDKGAMLDHTPLKFGKYKGKTAEWVSENDPQYLKWAYETVDKFNVCSDALYREIGGRKKRATASKAAETVREQQQAPRRDKQLGYFDDMDDDIPF